MAHFHCVCDVLRDSIPFHWSGYVSPYPSLSLSCICLYHSNHHSLSLSSFSVFLEDKYMMTPGVANIVNSIIYFMSVLASPVLGIAVDRTGCNLFWCMLSVFISYKITILHS